MDCLRFFVENESYPFMKLLINAAESTDLFFPSGFNVLNPVLSVSMSRNFPEDY